MDSVGELRYWWGVSDIAFVGGSFGNRGGQNMMEPAAFGSAVCFGPNTRNFKSETQSLTETNSCVQLNRPNELTDFVAKCLDDHDYRNELGSNAKRLISSYTKGDETACEKTLKMLARNNVNALQTLPNEKAA